MQAREVYALQLPRAKLVVLAACNTAIERVYGGEGGVGVARPFIKAGVPAVVATLWAVDSEVTARLMVRFHQHRAKGMSASEALQKSQLEMATGEDARLRAPYYWAGFVVIGGYSDSKAGVK
jgi:CHAT domain-containing protein